MKLVSRAEMLERFPIPEHTTMNEEQVNLQAIQQFVEQHADRKLIEEFAKELRRRVNSPDGDAFRIAIALVGAELAAQP